VPAAATNIALQRRDRLRSYYLRGGRIASVGFIPPLCFFLVGMPAFIEVWVGPQYVHVAPVAQVFLASFILAMVPAIGDAMLLGMGEARRTVKVTWIAAATNLVVSLSLVRPLGILGVVIGTIAGAFVSDVWLSIIHWKVLDIAPRLILKEIIRPMVVIASLSLLVSLLVSMALGPSTPVAFLVSGVISACAAYTLGFFIALDRGDRTVAIRVARQLIGVRGLSGSDDEPLTPALLGTSSDTDRPQ
jgi:O-antigen/teichoic acid export membrane protein